MQLPRLALAAIPTLLATASIAALAEAPFLLEKSPPDTGAIGFDTTLFDALPAYSQVRSASFSGWADTGMYIGTQMGRYPQMHLVATPGADRQQLTFFPRRMAGFYSNPVSGRRNFLYTEDEGGNEEFRIRLHNLRTGSGRSMGAPPGRVEGLVWNDSGTAFAYSHTPAGTDRWDLRLGRSDGRDTLLLSLPGTWSPMDLRPDGKRLLAQKYVSASEAELFILDLTDGSLRPLLPGEKPAYADQAQWMRGPAAGGKAPAWYVVFTSDREGEFHRIYRIDPDRINPNRPSVPGQAPALAAAESAVSRPEAWSNPADWDVEWISPAPDRRSLVYSLNEEGYSRLYLKGPDRKPARALAGIPQGVVHPAVFRPPRTRPDGTAAENSGGTGAEQEVFAFTLNTAASSGDVYSYDIARKKTTRWTFSETGGLPASTFRAPQLVRYPTFDSLPAAGAAAAGGPGDAQRRTIPAWLYLPDAKAFPGPRPALILVHGGPEMQARPGFDPFLQYLVGSLGMAVVQPNVRGSSGYGRAWQKADDGFLRMRSVRDLGALLAWIRSGGAGGQVDASRLAVSGRSYGGFMSLSALVEYGPLLRAGISTVGIGHFPTFLEKTSGYRRDLRRAEYGDERDPRMAAFLDSISPLTRRNRIATPLLLCHGRNDPRVPYGESQRIFAALKGRKVPVWFLTFADEGHAVRDLENQVVQWRTTAEFLIRELGTPTRP